MLIVIGFFVMLEAIIGFFLKTMLSKKQDESRWNIIIYGYFIFGLLLFLSTLVIFGLWIHTREETKNISAKKQLVDNLHAEYKDDALSSTETVSNFWNMAFMKLDCCAVNAVFSTTNDFDQTPWCTTSGECQQTNSQIPKTCCNGVTVSTSSSAPSTCHANVDSGTYNNQGCYDVLIVVAILALYISKSYTGNKTSPTEQ
ncbi:uncharacterized protein LOC134237677 [Saccostrea cucullata]|uniref:uncharacterized protein LOC134237677 n=1 Tax=Saccostrea cuccullata TaxID=36930 RepID=UPI002ED23B7B